MTISLNLSENEALLIQKYAELNEMTIGEFLRQSVLERIEDEYDLQAFEQAMQDFQINPQTYTLAEIKQDFGLQ